jgi:hypothetical protein
MAKKAKIKRTKKRKQREPLVFLEPECALTLRLSRELQKEPETLRRLAHRVVDLVADSGRYDWLAGSVTGDLVCICDDIVLKNLSDLIREARADGKAVSRG